MQTTCDADHPPLKCDKATVVLRVNQEPIDSCPLLTPTTGTDSLQLRLRLHCNLWHDMMIVVRDNAQTLNDASSGYLCDRQVLGATGLAHVKSSTWLSWHNGWMDYHDHTPYNLSEWSRNNSKIHPLGPLREVTSDVLLVFYFRLSCLQIPSTPSKNQRNTANQHSCTDLHVLNFDLLSESLILIISMDKLGCSINVNPYPGR